MVLSFESTPLNPQSKKSESLNSFTAELPTLCTSSNSEEGLFREGACDSSYVCLLHFFTILWLSWRPQTNPSKSRLMEHGYSPMKPRHPAYRVRNTVCKQSQRPTHFNICDGSFTVLVTHATCGVSRPCGGWCGVRAEMAEPGCIREAASCY